ncbi:MAG TPA: porin [Accumulibacter sp.]|nr:porin [Accumulibacter sp.]HQC80001.1 porin [Accumulibacter sp.]
MQKKLIALAVAGLASGAAFAQTNVTMYGVADVGYVFSQGDAPRSAFVGLHTTKPEFSGIQSGLLSGSRIGFKGEEALGNGLKAVFTLEYGLSLDTNAGVGTALARQQYVGLAGNWGQIALGRQYAPGYDATARNDALAGAAIAPQSFLSAGAGNTFTPNSGARWDNAVTFTTANYGGFTGKAIYSFGEQSPTGNYYSNLNDNIWDGGKLGLGANYANGPLNIDVAYQSRLKNRIATPTTTKLYDINEWYIGASFDLKFAKLMASYQDQNDKNNWSGTQNDNTIWTVGAVVPVMSSSAIHLTYAQLDFDQRTYAGGFRTGKGYTGKSDSFGIAFTHGLSKRTTLYTGYFFVDNDKRSAGFSPAGTGLTDQQNNSFVAGIRHTF